MTTREQEIRQRLEDADRFPLHMAWRMTAYADDVRFLLQELDYNRPNRFSTWTIVVCLVLMWLVGLFTGIEL